MARSELARMSTTRLEPSVALRRREFETRTVRREARSLDVQPQQGNLVNKVERRKKKKNKKIFKN